MKKKHTSLILLRIFLLCLIVLNMIIIFSFSAQNGEKSTQTTEKLQNAVLNTFAPDIEEQPSGVVIETKAQLTLFLRKSAHVIEFFTLGALTLLFLLTWKRPPFLWAAVALGFSLLYAISDEVHQLFIDGRSAHALDVLIDTAGALGGILLVLLIHTLGKRRKCRLTVTQVSLPIASPSPLRIAVAADLHDMGHAEALDAIRALSPDLILIPGDLTDDEGLADADSAAYPFLEACAQIAPTYYSPGNHEIACYHRGNPFRHPTPIPISEEAKERIRRSGAVLLDNDVAAHGSVLICGLRSGINKKENRPDEKALHRFAEMKGFRILLCHHPEYYVPYIRSTDIDLTFCGHAHGGQWRIFGRGIYAPGQGLFPKYTAGVIDGRCVISRGIGNHAPVPRILNRPELILIETAEKSEAEHTK